MVSISYLKRMREADRLQAVTAIVDDVSRRIENRALDEGRARDLIASVRFQISLIMPEKMSTYDLIYGARFERLIRQFIRGEN